MNHSNEKKPKEHNEIANKELKEQIADAALEMLEEQIDYQDLINTKVVFGYLFDIEGHGIEALLKVNNRLFCRSRRESAAPEFFRGIISRNHRNLFNLARLIFTHRERRTMMDKKMICGVLVTVIGLAFSMFTLAYAAMNPWDYNGIDGLLGSLLGTQMLMPLMLSMTVMLAGLGYCFWCAYRKDK